jgi:Arc/MetJ-type ribon-helix-helix transcriptional regulator
MACMKTKAPLPLATKAKPTDAEKITINLGYVDLGQIDLLVAEGFYGNRTDFIRTAIRNQLTVHSEAVKQVVARQMLVLGIQHISSDELRALKQARQKVQIRVLGLATIAQDVTPELALATIESLHVLGALHASPAVKTALASRLR